jgi:hypothetical protein
MTEKTRLAPVPNGFSSLYVHRLGYNAGVTAVSWLFFKARANRHI